MRYLVAASALALGLAGCASSHDRTMPTRVSDAAPPRFVLDSIGGRQLAVRESSCAIGAGGGACADTARLEPRRLTVVRRGDLLSIQLARARMVHGAGGPSAEVHRLGCTEILERFRLGTGGSQLTVALPPGIYEVQLFSRFRAGSVSGDVAGVAGLEVVRRGRARVVAAPRTVVARC